MTFQPSERKDPDPAANGSSVRPVPPAAFDAVHSRASRPMKTMAIRELSAPAIKEAAASGQIIGITNDRVLAAVLYPISQVLTEQLISENLARILHNIGRGERELVFASQGDDGENRPGGDGLMTLEELAASPPDVASVDLSRARQVNLRDLSGKVLSEAARANQAIALTTNRVVAGVVVPVPEQWLTQLVSQNLSRLLRTIEVGERDLTAGGELTALDDVVADKSHDPESPNGPGPAAGRP